MSGQKMEKCMSKDWEHLASFFHRKDADKVYGQLDSLPWMDSTKANTIGEGLCFGASYSKPNHRTIEMVEIPTFLSELADRVSTRTRVPWNYIQVHRFDSEHSVHPHRDPAGMTVPMLIVGQERTFRVGGTMPEQYQRRPQSERPVECHIPAEELLLCHGDLLIFNGGHTCHSMRPASQDARFNRNDSEWRFSILCRWTTEAMRKYGTRICNNYGQAEQYAAAIQQFREQQQGRLF